ncbi:MAG: hypothetical protein IJE67_00710, partial [Peptococcaceae bacterium]|nr:hypothetical protein [Peptococcaceae bacterium]
YMHGKDDRDPKYYRLEDGSVILTELMSFAHFDILDYEREDYSFDENDTFLQLPIAIQHKILAYYKELGTLYDLEAELENAYLLYKRQIEAGDTYWTGESDADGVIRNQSPGVYQNTSEAGHNDSIICFYTDMQKTLPAALQPEQDNKYFMPEITGGFYGLYTVFDVSTGDVINQYDLFTIPEEEIGEYLFSIPDYLSDEERAKMIVQLRPEYIGFTSDNLSIWFPHETINGNGYLVSIEYEDIKDILKPWAIPVHEKV